jgi:hypothetical protein
MKLIQVDAARAVFGWRLFATWNAWIYASSHHGWAAKVNTFLTFVPVLALTTVIWAVLLAAIIWLFLRLA